MRERPLWDLLFFEPAFYEAARIIGYAGIEPFAFWDKAKELGLIEQLGKAQLQQAVEKLTLWNKREQSPPRYEFTREARKWMFQLLGPAPEHPDREFLLEAPPLVLAEDVAKWKAERAGKEVSPAKPKQATKRAKGQADGNGYAILAREKSSLQLHCMLRDARQQLKHHGARSFVGKQAKKEIAAVEEEMRTRNIDVPPEGQETAQWEKR